MNTVGADSRPEYYRQSGAAVLEALGSHKMGLTNAAAERRHSKDGANILPVLRSTTGVQEWLAAAIHPSIFGLLISTLLASLLGQSALTIWLLAIAACDASLRYAVRRNPQLAALPEIPTHCLVVRNGQNRHIETPKLVVGDIIQLQAGDIVPADVRLLTTTDFMVDESILFGSEKPIAKSTTSIKSMLPLEQRENLAWTGTMVSHGTAAAIVTAIGTQTELGRIIVLANTVSSQKRPQRWHKLWLGAVAGFMLVAALGWFSGVPDQALLSGLFVLSLSLLPLGLSISRFGMLWRLKPRANISVATLSRFGVIDTLLTHERTVTRFKLFKLHLLHIGHATTGLALRGLSDSQLFQQLQHGSATFGELTAEEELRLVRCAQMAGHRVAVVGSGFRDLPAQLQAEAAILYSGTLAVLLSAARSGPAWIAQIRHHIQQWMLALTSLAIVSLAGDWYAHLPLAISPQIVIFFVLVAVPVAAFGLRSNARKSSLSELATRSLFAAVLAYGSYVLVFAAHGIDPTFIDPANPLTLVALGTVLAVLIICLAVESIIRNWGHITFEKLIIKAGCVLVLIGALYIPLLNSALGVAQPDFTDWLLIITAGTLYGCVILLQHHGRHHSRAAVVKLHHKTFGKNSAVRI